MPPEPTDTPVPAEPTATDTPEPPKTVAIVQANLRQGPSTFYPIVGQVQQNGAVEVVAQSPDLQWLKLANDAWIYKPLVAGVPADVPIAIGVEATPRPTAAPRPTATPTRLPTPTRTPTPTPTPERGDWGQGSSSWRGVRCRPQSQNESARDKGRVVAQDSGRHLQPSGPGLPSWNRRHQ